MKKLLALFVVLLLTLFVFNRGTVLACTKNNDCSGSERCVNGRCEAPRKPPQPTNPPPPPEPTTIPKPTVVIQPTTVILPQPSATPTPTPDLEETTTPPAIGSKDYCQGVTISGTNLTSGNSLTLTATAKNTNIKTFSYRFYNTDNANKAIIFKIGGTNRSYTRTIKNSFTSSSNTITVKFAQLDRNDLNWTSAVYGHPKPKHIKVAAYFTDASNATSKNAVACNA